MANFQNSPILMIKLLTSLSLSLIFCAINTQATTAGCSTLSYCQCSFSNGTGIDLSSVDKIENPLNRTTTIGTTFRPANFMYSTTRLEFISIQNETVEIPDSEKELENLPIVQHELENSRVKYKYFPCSTNKETSCPNNGALCSISDDGKETLLGTLQNVTFAQDFPDGTIHVQYTYPTGNTTAVTVLVLRCTPTSDANIIEPDPLVSGRLVLHSKAACLTTLSLREDNKGISNGSVLVVMVLVFFSLYFFGGMAILKFIRGASGVEIIPHYEFWSDLPSLVKDGIVFTIRCCQGSASYDRI